MEEIIMGIIMQSGDARSSAMEAVQWAKKGDMEKAAELIAQANEKLIAAHGSQTKLIQAEIQGDKIEISLLMVHAQDHLMNAIAVRDMAKEFVDLYQRLV